MSFAFGGRVLVCLMFRKMISVCWCMLFENYLFGGKILVCWESDVIEFYFLGKKKMFGFGFLRV